MDLGLDLEVASQSDRSGYRPPYHRRFVLRWHEYSELELEVSVGEVGLFL